MKRRSKSRAGAVTSRSRRPHAAGARPLYVEASGVVDVKYFSCSTHRGTHLPEPLRRWVTHEQGCLVGGTVSSPRVPLVIERQAMRLEAPLLSGPEVLLLVLAEHSETVSVAKLEKFGLTRREAEVLAWLARGKTNSEIGKIAEMSSRTVEKHMVHLLQKLGVENRTAAAIRALQADELCPVPGG